VKREDLIPIVEKALQSHGGKARAVDVAKYVWKNHRADLQKSGNLFFTWQFATRWAANSLRKNGRMKPEDVNQKGIWELKK
jgi:hypothetical protein